MYARMINGSLMVDNHDLSMQERERLGYMPVEFHLDGQFENTEPYFEVENNVIIQKWRPAEPPPDPEEPFDVFMTEILADHEFRLCLMELGVTEDDL